jgi:GAF domain-containing protein
MSPPTDPVSPMHATSPQPEIETLRQRVRTLERERTHLLTVIEILQEVAGSLQFSDVVQAVSRKLGEAFGLDRSSVFLVERGGEVVRLVATYEDPSIRNYVVDVERYPELKRAIQSGRTVFIPDVASDPALRGVRGNLATRRVKSITVVPITWRGRAIGAIFLRTFRDGPSFSDEDVRFCEVVASLTAKALRNAHRFERLRATRGEDPAIRALDRERVALLGFLRRLLVAAADREGPWGEEALGRADAEELDRLVGVAMTVIAQEANSR